ncbi:hypothetical protein Hanom_Chr04g00297431 [Helianthus anomalus]
MATSPHSNPEVAGSSLARSQCPYGNGFTPRLRLAGWRSARWDYPGGWGGRGTPPPPPPSPKSLIHRLRLFSVLSYVSVNCECSSFTISWLEVPAKHICIILDIRFDYSTKLRLLI